MTLTAPAVRRRLRALAVPGNVAILQRFFKTRPGEYGEGDRFIGVKAQRSGPCVASAGA
jgi:hypothetical protein